MTAKYLLSALLVLMPSFVAADQIRTVSDGMTVSATVSSVNTNRITLSNDRVVSLYATEGDFTYQHDPRRGDLFIQLPDGGQHPIAFFLTTEQGYTYKIILTPQQIPSETVLIQNPAANGSLNDKAATMVSTSPQQQIAELIRSMSLGEMLDGYSYRQLTQIVPLGTELTALRVRVYESGAYIGEQWLVRPAGLVSVRLSPANFQAVPGLAAVEIPTPEISPGQVVPVHIVIRRGGNRG